MATSTALRTRSRVLSVFAIASLFSLLLAACGGGGGGGGIKTDVGVDTSTKTINLGILTPLSGPVAAPIGVPLTQGIEVYFKSLNDRGGIDGYKVHLIEKDTMYNPPTQVEQYNAIKGQVLMFAESLGTPTTQAIKDLVNRDKILVTVASLDSYLARQPYMVMVGTPYRLQVENAFDYVVKQPGVTSPKTGLIYQDDSYGQDGQTGYTEAVAAYHLTDVGQASYELTDTSFVSQVAKMKQGGAQYVFLTAIPTVAAKVIATGYQLGYTPHWIMQSPAWSPLLLGNASLAALLEHTTWVMGQGAAWGDSSKPAMAQMLSDVQKYQPDEQPNGYFEYGYSEAIVTAAILKKAADSGDLTRAGVVNAFNSLGTVNMGGLLPDIHYGSSPNQRVPSRDSSVYTIDPTVPGNVKDISGDFTGTAAQASQF
ncbi:MAG TPA: ABC transporter substrate-binding protein [Ktedonobacterales bacterium]|nr:ABC transporter substrate-binding protein [Ktedonobacterales bacterium]